MTKIPERIVNPHTLTSIHFGCTLNPVYLQPWHKTPPEIQAYWADVATHAVPCDGTGATGTACFDCRYVDVLDVESD